MNAVNAACDRAWFGWPCDQSRRLRDAFARAGNESERKVLAEQGRCAPWRSAPRSGGRIPDSGGRAQEHQGIVTGYFLVLWNVEKQRGEEDPPAGTEQP
jgi:peptide/nickel transport system substrate-binding protein